MFEHSNKTQKGVFPVFPPELGSIVRAWFLSLKEHYLITAIAGGAFYFLLYTLSFVGDESFTRVVKDIKHFLVSYKGFVTSFLLALVIFGQKAYQNINRKYSLGQIAEASGIYFYSPNKEKEHNQPADDFLKEKSLESNTIKILGASGWKTFASCESPMHEAVKTAETVKCILMHPDSLAIPERVAHLNKNRSLEERKVIVKEYQDEIRKSIDFLQSIQSSTKRIRLKFYTRYPVWKLIILDSYAYVQQYQEEQHVQNCPAAAYQRVADKTGLFTSYRLQFERNWNSLGLDEYDFEKKVVPPIKKIKN